MLHPKEITGVVLAGGKSSRFGSNKALSLYDGKSFLKHIIELIQPYTKEVVVAGFYPEYEDIGIPVLEDKTENIGPLGGIYTALTYCTTPWILVLTCDMPLLTEEIIKEMMAIAKDQNMIGWNNDKSGGVFPLLISKNILPNLEKAIEKKQYRVKQLFEWDNSLIMAIPEKWDCLFANINNQQEYKNILT